MKWKRETFWIYRSKKREVLVRGVQTCRLYVGNLFATSHLKHWEVKLRIILKWLWKACS